MAKKDGKNSKAHQNTVLLTDPATGVSMSYTAKVRANGNAKATIGNKNIPQALRGVPLTISAVVGSFGDDKPARVEVASNVVVARAGEYKRPERFEALPEIKHVFRAPPRTVNSVIAVGCAGVVAFLLVSVLGVFASNGLGSVTKAFSDSPVGHAGLVGSLVAYEVVFIMYYLGSSIFTTLAAVGAVTPIAIYTGSRALRELRARRIAGQFN